MCDDGNTVNGDGCDSECNEVDDLNFVCKHGLKTVCEPRVEGMDGLQNVMTYGMVV